jgi:hypothetical protein
VKALKETGIIFQGRLVRATLADVKKQTRRLQGLDLLNRDPSRYTRPVPQTKDRSVWIVHDTLDNSIPHALKCPYGGIGDRLWVRETWQAVRVAVNPETGYGDRIYYPRDIPKSSENGWWAVAYAADPAWPGTESREERGFPWRPSIFMPRWASRLSLKITDVRLEQLQSIRPGDIGEEGLPVDYTVPDHPWALETEQREAFKALWDGLNAKKAPWAKNPWVWAITFARKTT